MMNYNIIISFTFKRLPTIVFWNLLDSKNSVHSSHSTKFSVRSAVIYSTLTEYIVAFSGEQGVRNRREI